MRFWIKCTRFGKEEPCCVNFSLVEEMGVMARKRSWSLSEATPKRSR